jgi:dihydroorotase
VTAEVTPHHLAFDDSDLEAIDPSFKMMPPLRSRTDRDALRAGLRSGAIDAVATDHAPHAAHEKNVDFDAAPFGVIGLADAAAVVNSVVGLDARTFFDRMSVAPARIGRADEHGRWAAPGSPANLVVFDPIATGTSSETGSRSINSPYLGKAWRGEVRATIRHGQLTHRFEGMQT